MSLAVTIAAWVGLVAALWLTVFQLLIVAGAPFGHLAWGGQHRGRLPRGHRAASLATSAVTLAIASAFGQANGLWAPWSETALFAIFVASAVLFALSTVANLASASRPERLHGVPIALVLCLASAVLAVS